MLISLRTLNQLVVRQAYGLSKIVETTQEIKDDWVTKYLGSDYPQNFSIIEVIEDFFDVEINDSSFRSTFVCPNCGRLSIANSAGEWDFFNKEHK